MHDCRYSQQWPEKRLGQSDVEKLARSDGNQNDTCVGSSLGFVAHITNRDARIMKAVNK